MHASVGPHAASDRQAGRHSRILSSPPPSPPHCRGSGCNDLVSWGWVGGHQHRLLTWLLRQCLPCRDQCCPHPPCSLHRWCLGMAWCMLQCLWRCRRSTLCPPGAAARRAWRGWPSSSCACRCVVGQLGAGSLLMLPFRHPYNSAVSTGLHPSLHTPPPHPPPPAGDGG